MDYIIKWLKIQGPRFFRQSLGNNLRSNQNYRGWDTLNRIELRLIFFLIESYY